MKASKPSIQIASDDTASTLKEKLADVELKKKEQIAEQQAQKLGVSYINLRAFPIGPEVLSLVSEQDARALEVLPFFRENNQIRLGAIDPKRPEVQTLLAQLHKTFPDSNVEIFLISNHSFHLGLSLYKTIPKYIPTPKGVTITGQDLERFQNELGSFEELDEKLKTVNLSDTMALLIASSMNAGSSDIHIEAEEGDILVRFRIDGILKPIAKMNKDSWPRLVNRIKEVSGLKINVSNVPQDGRITVHLKENSKMDIRVSSLPNAFGESIVMRLLKSNIQSLAFEELGLRAPTAEALNVEIKRPNGMIVTTGPTGSGKTTTLYAILNKLNTPEVKIITLEDPIEYELQGITQSQIDTSRNYTFEKGLRSILRQDPDIIMVGEIRDLETAEIAIQAALTGHLVISTIHTNDAAGAIPRFLSMGVKPFLLAPALNVVMGQRLVRRLCECKQPATLRPQELERARSLLQELPQAEKKGMDINHVQFYEPKGCERCHHIGYHGRIGIYEVFPINSKIEEVILSGKVSEYQMRDIAKADGMVFMVQDGLVKAAQGLTSVSEVFRVAE